MLEAELLCYCVSFCLAAVAAAAALATVAQYYREARAEVSKKAWNVHWNHASSSLGNQLAQLIPSESSETAEIHSV